MTGSPRLTTPRHIGLWDQLTRNGFAGAWRTVACALSSWDGFTHVVVHNGPLWRLCRDCRELRACDELTEFENELWDQGRLSEPRQHHGASDQPEAILYNTKQARRGGACG